MEQQVEQETQMMVCEASEMANQVMNLHKNLDPGALAFARTLYLNSSLQLVSLKRTLETQMIIFQDNMDRKTNQAVHHLQGQIVESERKVTNFIRQELDQATTVVHERLDSVQEQIQGVKNQLSDQNPVSQAWRSGVNIHLRQIIAFILFLAMDTTNAFGMASLVHFMQYPGREETEENHLIILSKSLIKMLLIHKENFTPPVNKNIQSKVETTILPIFGCLTDLLPKDSKLAAAMFPTKFYPSPSGGIYVVRTMDLIPFFQEELKYEKKGKGVLLKDADFSLNTKLGEDGSVKIVNNKDGKKIRPMVPVNLDSLEEFTGKVISKKIKKPAIYDFLSKRRYWNMPASKEYLQTKAFHTGVCLIRRYVYSLETPKYNPNKPFHLGRNFSINTKAPVHPFSYLLAKFLRMDEATLLQHFQLDNAVPYNDEDDEKQPSPTSSCSSSSCSGSYSSSSSSSSTPMSKSPTVTPTRRRGRSQKNKLEESDDDEKEDESTPTAKQIKGDKKKAKAVAVWEAAGQGVNAMLDSSLAIQCQNDAFGDAKEFQDQLATTKQPKKSDLVATPPTTLTTPTSAPATEKKKRGPGRPKKSEKKQGKSVPPTPSTPAAATAPQPLLISPPTEKKRGRPKKRKSESCNEEPSPKQPRSVPETPLRLPPMLTVDAPLAAVFGPIPVMDLESPLRSPRLDFLNTDDQVNFATVPALPTPTTSPITRRGRRTRSSSALHIIPGNQ